MSEPQSIGRNEPCPCKSGKKYKRCCGVNAAPKLSIPQNITGGPAFDPSSVPGFDPKMMENMDPQWMGQVSQAIQRLPKGQLQRLQSLMQKAMHGKDVTAEAQELEKSLPPEFQTLMQTWAQSFENLPGGPGGEDALPADPSQALAGLGLGNMGGLAGLGGLGGFGGSNADALPAPEAPAAPMTLEQARELVAQAAKKGVISEDQAQSLLQKKDEASEPVEDSSETASPEMASPSQGVQDASQAGLTSDQEGASKIGKFWKKLTDKAGSGS